MTEADEIRLFPAIVKGSLLLLFLFSLAGYFACDLNMAVGIFVGGSIATVNFVWQRSVLQRILGLSVAKPLLYLQVRYILRLALTGIALYVCIKFTGVSVFGLLIGLSVVVISITLLALYFAVNKGE